MIRRRLTERFTAPPSGIAETRFHKVKQQLDMDAHRLMRKYYFHTHEMYLERIFDRHLAPGATFIDIGANCGYWSAYALSRVGTSGQVHAFEPVPDYFAFLRRLAELNPDFNMNANNVACGAQPGRLPMTVVPPRPENFDNYNTNIGSSSLAPSVLDHARALTETISVEVIRVDDYLVDRNIDLDRIGLIKIDVEGFEAAVFDGMHRILDKPGRKVPILCEILTDRALATPLDGAKTIARLEDAGYRCVDAMDLKPIDRTALNYEENILCT
jgi:FkbM family methyltransferase